MEFVEQLIAAVRHHPVEVLICLGVPVALAVVLNGDGLDLDWFDKDCDGGGGDGD